MAVYTEVSEAALAAFLSTYDAIASTGLEGIADGIDNSNYRLSTDKNPLILTVFEGRLPAAELPFFLNLMQHLAAKGLPAPLPIANRQGGFLGQIAGKPAALVSFCAGAQLKRWEPSHTQALGAILARLHLATTDFSQTRPNSLGQSHWASLAAPLLPEADKVQASLALLLQDELATLKALWPRDAGGLASGIIHADLFPNNVLWHDHAISGLLDYYFACTDFYAYDLAICLNAWCFESDGAFNISKARALLAGYQHVRPLSPAETAALPILCRGAALRFLLTRLSAWLSPTSASLGKKLNPLEYVQKLNFHRKVSAVSAYGLDI